jgi:hypothetical protein
LGLSLIPYGAHLFSMPNKIGMTPDAYLTAQRAYDGWALLSFIFIPALIALVALAVVMRGQRTPFRFAVAAAATFLVTLAVFFAFTYPANVATDNWTQMPANWSSLRRQWEYSHAVNALLAFAAFSFATLYVVLAKPDTA